MNNTEYSRNGFSRRPKSKIPLNSLSSSELTLVSNMPEQLSISQHAPPPSKYTTSFAGEGPV